MWRGVALCRKGRSPSHSHEFDIFKNMQSNWQKDALLIIYVFGTTAVIGMKSKTERERERKKNNKRGS